MHATARYGLIAAALLLTTALVPLPSWAAEVPVVTTKVFVNQAGYGLDWPKRFSAPGFPDGTRFKLEPATGGAALFEGALKGGVGDFTTFRPTDTKALYVVRLENGAVSDPFQVQGVLPIDVSLNAALRFMVDARSLVGTHPSAYGGQPWRDGTYYTFELPSLVMLWLAHPDYFRQVPVEIDYQADKARILDPGFHWVRDLGDEGALDVVRRYYTEIEPPVGGKAVPDLVQMLHWGVGFHLTRPVSHDPSGDPVGEKLHAQTVAQLAYFLYGLPEYAQWIPASLQARTKAFVFEQWEKVGLFGIDNLITAFKGRNPPGYAITPNLMMYEVAKREGRADADRFLDAAARQAAWIINNLDLSDPALTKGQRMSEHMVVTGLYLLASQYPDKAPPGLERFLKRYGELAVARSDNEWDFRRYDAGAWTIPRYSVDNVRPKDPVKAAKPHGWNEVGNVVGMPGVASMLAEVADPAQRSRLHEIGIAHLDAMFGRNPLAAHAANNAPRDYPGVERGWPLWYPFDLCARLETVRGTINASASDEQYKQGPAGASRHLEGWTAFNATYNVTLARLIHETTRVELLDAATGAVVTGVTVDRPVRIAVTAPPGAAPVVLSELSVEREGGEPLKAVWEQGRFVTAPIPLATLAGTLHYGDGYWASNLVIVRDGAGFIIKP